jgi:hypothetical protein
VPHRSPALWLSWAFCMILLVPYTLHALAPKQALTRTQRKRPGNAAGQSPTAKTILSVLEGLESPGSPLMYDHIAFRTFGVRRYQASTPCTAFYYAMPPSL